MNIHEYQAKKLLKQFGVGVPEGFLIEEGTDVGGRAEKAASDFQAQRKNSVFHTNSSQGKHWQFMRHQLQEFLAIAHGMEQTGALQARLWQIGEARTIW